MPDDVVPDVVPDVWRCGGVTCVVRESASNFIGFRGFHRRVLTKTGWKNRIELDAHHVLPTNETSTGRQLVVAGRRQFG